MVWQLRYWDNSGVQHISHPWTEVRFLSNTSRRLHGVFIYTGMLSNPSISCKQAGQICWVRVRERHPQQPWVSSLSAVLRKNDIWWEALKLGSGKVTSQCELLNWASFLRRPRTALGIFGIDKSLPIPALCSLTNQWWCAEYSFI